MSNKTNGAVNRYIVSLNPSTRLFSGDVFTIQFPPSILLPDILDCSVDGGSYVLQLSCAKLVDQQVRYTFIDVDSSHEPGTTLLINMGGVRNPISLRPTAPFDKMALLATGLYPMADYK